MSTQRIRHISFSLLLIALVTPPVAFAGAAVLENPAIRYEVTESGRSLALIDTSSGVNLMAAGADTPVCTLQKNGATWESLSLAVRDGLWHMGFGDAGVSLVLRVEAHPTHVTFEVVSLSGEGVDQLNFLYLPLGAEGRQSNLALCSLALNLQTNVPELPGPMLAPQASCYARFGFAGAKAALIAAPRDSMRAALQQVIAAEQLPHSALGGPWALDAEINRGSYLIDTEGEFGEATADAWIALAKNLGMKQVDLHTGKSMRFGDLRPNPERYPNGAAGVKAAVDKLRAAGLVAGLHTYAFFIAKDTPWVTPVPDRRLATSATFTLDADTDAVVNTIPVAESTASVSTITGFQIRNSVTLRIDDELVVFSGVNTEAPFGFTNCERGALGTSPAPHAKGAEVVQLKECFGLFVPDGDSTLFTEVAARTAEVYNQAGFEMIYLDALDGSDILAGGLNGWHYAAKFVDELRARLERPALFEMSTMTHHLWRLRSRMGAWDVPARGAQRLADIHALANEAAGNHYMPVNLGWSGIFNWNPVQPERTFADDVAHLCARALAADASLSLLVGFTPDSWEASANVRRLGGIIRQYESLRMDRTLPAPLLAKLRASDAPFIVEQDPEGRWQARNRHAQSHRVTSVETSAWTVHNPYGAQAPRLRIEVLSAIEPYDHAAAIVLADGNAHSAFGIPETAEGMTLVLGPGGEAPASAGPSLALKAHNAGAPQHTSWAGTSKQFSPPLDLQGRGLGLWIHGDGKGAILNVQLQSTNAAAGGRAHHYVDLDFMGWRYVELIEPESARLGTLGWPFSTRHADWNGNVPFGEVLHDYILWTHYGQIEQITLWLNQVPPGETVECRVGPIRRLPLRPTVVEGVSLAWNGQQVVVPEAMQSGEYIEIAPDGSAAIYDATGAQRHTLSLGSLPTLVYGNNALLLDSATTPSARVRVTLTTFDEAIAPD